MTDYGDNPFRRGHVQGRAHDVVQQRVAAGLMQNLRLLRHHARPQPGGQNHDRYICLHLTLKRCALSASRRTWRARERLAKSRTTAASAVES